MTVTLVEIQDRLEALPAPAGVLDGLQFRISGLCLDICIHAIEMCEVI